MEKKYLVAVAKLPMMGETQVVFDDVKDIVATDNILEFNDIDGHYKFEKVNNLWHEVDDKAPDLSEYKIVGRRTARRHDLVGDDRTEAHADNWRQLDRDERTQRDLAAEELNRIFSSSDDEEE